MDYSALLNALREENVIDWANELETQLPFPLNVRKHGDLQRWFHLIENLPALNIDYRLLADTIEINGNNPNLDFIEFKNTLKQLSPWRKGPYELFGIHIDTEWRSDWKWQRLENHIAPLKNRWVLDVGCGNGYHCWRMLGAGAKRVIGIDPMLINVMQFQFIKKLYGRTAPIDVLPFGIEKLSRPLKIFDTVFSMGVLYHRRSPLDHLMELKDCLKAGGELVLETLIIDGKLGDTLLPEDRYAQMRNVWFLPSCDTLKSWLNRCGFENIRLIDVTKTSTDEQRTTEWMTFYSLKDFLQSDNTELTCEGYPAPKRAIFLATAPNLS